MELYEPKFVQVLGILGTVQESMYLGQQENKDMKEELLRKKADIEMVEDLNVKIQDLTREMKKNQVIQSTSGNIGTPENY